MGTEREMQMSEVQFIDGQGQVQSRPLDYQPSFTKVAEVPGHPLGRAGVIHTPHGDVPTPAFIPVGTKATVKGVLPDTMRQLGANALLANAYHLFLQPGPEIVDQAGGLSQFMNWNGPTFTDSGGFQVLSLGSGYKKILSEEFSAGAQSVASGHADQTGVAAPAAKKPITASEMDKEIDRMASKKERHALVDDDGVTFRSHLSGALHRFTPEVSMQIQHQLGADVMFAFDELTTLLNSRSYQERSLERTRLWAQRCLAEHERLTQQRTHRPYQMLFGVIQGAQYEDLRRKAARDLGQMEIDGRMFDGFGIGGALEKENLGLIAGWVSSELPENKPRHLLGLSEPDDIFAGVESGADTFDCVNPSRVGRNGALYSPYGRFNITRSQFKADFRAPVKDCVCYTCQNYSAAYLHHLFKAKELLAFTLATIHNEFFTVQLVHQVRESILRGDYQDFKADTLGRFYGNVDPTTVR